MAKPVPHPVSYDHFAAFGAIINIMADLDGLLDSIIIAMVRGEPTILPLLTLLGQKDKLGYIVAIAKVSTMPPYAIDGLERLMERVRKAAGLRNQIAHCTWKAGRKPGTIKPLMLGAKSVLKILGIEHNEKQWTAAELMAEARRFNELGQEIKIFVNRYGLVPKRWRRRSGRKSRKSESKGG